MPSLRPGVTGTSNVVVRGTAKSGAARWNEKSSNGHEQAANHVIVVKCANGHERDASCSMPLSPDQSHPTLQRSYSLQPHDIPFLDDTVLRALKVAQRRPGHHIYDRQSASRHVQLLPCRLPTGISNPTSAAMSMRLLPPRSLSLRAAENSRLSFGALRICPLVLCRTTTDLHCSRRTSSLSRSAGHIPMLKAGLIQCPLCTSIAALMRR